jgi:hypothetical protein
MLLTILRRWNAHTYPFTHKRLSGSRESFISQRISIRESFGRVPGERELSAACLARPKAVDHPIRYSFDSSVRTE